MLPKASLGLTLPGRSVPDQVTTVDPHGRSRHPGGLVRDEEEGGPRHVYGSPDLLEDRAVDRLRYGLVIVRPRAHPVSELLGVNGPRDEAVDPDLVTTEVLRHRSHQREYPT